MVCEEGNCYWPCSTDGDCPEGSDCVIINGISVCVSDGDCYPDCPSYFECIEGNCYLGDDTDLCEFEEEVNGGSGAKTYSFYHGFPAGTPILFEYNTLARKDQIVISGTVIPFDTGCVPTNGWEEETLYTNGSPDIVITVTPCQTGSKYHFVISCPEQGLIYYPSAESLLSPPSVSNDNLIAGKINVHPNPFVSDVDISASNIEEPFTGQVILLDNFGRKVIVKEFAFETGYNSLNIDGLEDLGQGLYIILVKKDGEVYASKKVIKVK